MSKELNATDVALIRIAELERQVAKLQAVLVKKDEAINDICSFQATLDDRMKLRREAIALTPSSEVLESMIERAGDVMRERCAKDCEDKADDETMSKHVSSGHCLVTRGGMYRCAESIRALPGVKLEDL